MRKRVAVGVVAILMMLALVIPIITNAPAQIKLRATTATREISNQQESIKLDIVPTNEQLLNEAEKWKQSLGLQFDEPMREELNSASMMLEYLGGYSLRNVEPFLEFILSLPYDLKCLDSVQELGERMMFYHELALRQGIIEQIENDFLLIGTERLEEVMQNTMDSTSRMSDAMEIAPLWLASDRLPKMYYNTLQLLQLFYLQL